MVSYVMMFFARTGLPIPVQLRPSVPGPWYSMIAPVPPLTVRMPATFKIMSDMH